MKEEELDPLYYLHDDLLELKKWIKDLKGNKNIYLPHIETISSLVTALYCSMIPKPELVNITTNQLACNIQDLGEILKQSEHSISRTAGVEVLKEALDLWSNLEIDNKISEQEKTKQLTLICDSLRQAVSVIREPTPAGIRDLKEIASKITFDSSSIFEKFQSALMILAGAALLMVNTRKGNSLIAAGTNLFSKGLGKKLDA